MASNPYSGLSDYAKKRYNDTNTAINNYFNAASKNIENQTNEQVKEYTQKKQDADKDLFNQSRAANADYLKSINPYGYLAQSSSAKGLMGSGFSESTKSANFTSMQNRISNLKDNTEKTKREYDNEIANAYNNKNDNMAKLTYDTMNARSETLDDLLNRKIAIANGLRAWQLGQANLDLDREEFRFKKLKG